jgi:hypothetical protein
MSDKSNTYGWQHTGQKRPDFALEPGPGQESVWDYPRPPAIVDDARECAGVCSRRNLGGGLQ